VNATPASSFRSLFTFFPLFVCFVFGITFLKEMSWDIELDDQLLQDLYAWIDQIPLSRPNKRIEKDFSAGGKSIFFISPVLVL
jgi:hypothetical protein